MDHSPYNRAVVGLKMRPRRGAVLEPSDRAGGSLQTAPGPETEFRASRLCCHCSVHHVRLGTSGRVRLLVPRVRRQTAEVIDGGSSFLCVHTFADIGKGLCAEAPKALLENSHDLLGYWDIFLGRVVRCWRISRASAGEARFVRAKLGSSQLACARDETSWFRMGLLLSALSLSRYMFN